MRRLLKIDIERILEQLVLRRELLLNRWSFHRDRTPFLWTSFSRWPTLGYPQLQALDTSLTLVLDDFYAELEAFRLYIRSTEDMPEALEEVYDESLEALDLRGKLALEALQ